MKLWKISQDFNNRNDTYDSLIVAAETEEEAQLTEVDYECFGFLSTFWAHHSHVTAEYIGEAKEGTLAGIILGSFNAG
jgi:hypothetical protein